MSLSITQTPAEINLSQSPIIFTMYENNTTLTSTGSFQYVADLYYWTGTTANKPASPQYTLTKFPNSQNRGIFDVSKILNSLFTLPSEEVTSQTYYFSIDASYQYPVSGGGFVTGGNTSSSNYRVIEGYGLWGESIGEAIQNKSPHWPIMTDGPVTQSFFNTENYFNLSCYTGVYNSLQADKIVVTNSSGTSNITLTGTSNTSGQIQTFNLYQPGFDWFSIQAYDGATPLGTSIRFENECKKKYDNIRIKWKNRYGQFDYFNFNLVSKQTFNVSRQQYQPQLGQWEGATFAYNQYDSQIQNYLIDTQQTLSVNSDYIREEYNDILKQLMVSDEVYWVYVEGGSESLRPISINTSSFQIKTNVVDKLIQYSFDFDYGIPYKLVM